jgi:threonine aldolase
VIDLRSDTVTRPSDQMRKAMHGAEVGDDVFGDDPTVHRLEAATAERLGKEAGLFVTSGTQSNLCAILSHCQRGDAYVVGQSAHAYKYEAGGAAVLGGVLPHLARLNQRGEFALGELAETIVTDRHLSHYALSTLLCLENTNDGKVLDQDYVQAAQGIARESGLSVHLDGARLWHAAVAQDLPLTNVAEGFDSISACFSKGLGAPLGSVLTGDKELIEEAHRWRKMLGGGMRQAGVVAAAALYALDNHVERLADDHARAQRLAQGLREVPDIIVVSADTNMVFIDLSSFELPGLQSRLEAAGVVALVGEQMRLVTHLDINDDDIDVVLRCFTESANGA